MFANLVAAIILQASPVNQPDTLVVCPQQFRVALTPWVAHRTQQGHRILLINTSQTAEKVRADIRRQAKIYPLKFIVLIGDSTNSQTADEKHLPLTIPAAKVKAKVNIQWGIEKEIASDNWYADLDDDSIPDVAIGRITADSSEDLAVMVNKIIQYESAENLGAWCHKIHFVAGIGGFGKLADNAIEMGAKTLITSGIPPAYSHSMTYGSWRSVYCPDPRRFHQTTVDRLNEGGLFWVYMGHGHQQWLDTVRTPNYRFHILSTRDMSKLNCKKGSPIALMLACYTGAFDDKNDCIGEEMLRQPGGPVALICGSRVVMPYGNAVFTSELLHQLFAKKRKTLGEIILYAKQNVKSAREGDSQRKMLDTIAGLVNPQGSKLIDERIEHLHLYNLLGDPLLKIPTPETIIIDSPKECTAGQEIEIQGIAKFDGKATLELILRRDRINFKKPNRDRFIFTQKSMQQYDKVYRQANMQTLARVTVDVINGSFRKKLTIPKSATGRCHIKVFIQGKKQIALGANNIFILKYPTTKGS